MKNTKLRSRIAGFTLVELLVGLFLSIFIGGIALTYFASSSRTFRTHTNESVLQENARFAMEILSRYIRHAGLNPSASFANEMDVIFSGAICSSSESGLGNNASGSTACTKDGANNAADNNSDRLALDYMYDASKEIANQTMTGCNGLGVTVNAGDERRFASVFWTADIDGDGVRSLYCQTMDLESNTAVGGALPLVDGVDRIQVQYGVDSDDIDANGDNIPDEGYGIVDRYQSFTNLGAVNSGRVRTIRVSLLMNSGLLSNGDTRQGVSEVSEARDFALLDAAEEELEDAVLRQIYSTTVMVHNVPEPETGP